jgi:hypothetical protein
LQKAAVNALTGVGDGSRLRTQNTSRFDSATPLS